MHRVPSASWKSGSTTVSAHGGACTWVQSWVSGRDRVSRSSLLPCFLCVSSEHPTLLLSSPLECWSITHGIGAFNLGWFIHPLGHGGQNRNATKFGQNQISTKKNPTGSLDVRVVGILVLTAFGVSLLGHHSCCYYCLAPFLGLPRNPQQSSIYIFHPTLFFFFFCLLSLVLGGATSFTNFLRKEWCVGDKYFSNLHARKYSQLIV